MDIEEFKKILKENKMTLTKFSELSGVKYGTCRQWGKNNRPVSDWVKSWFNLYEKNKRLEALKNDDCEEYKKALAKALQDNLNH